MMTKTVHWWSWSCDLHRLSERSFFSRKYFRRPHRHPQKLIFYISGRKGDHEWLRMTNAFILCDLVWNVQKSHTSVHLAFYFVLALVLCLMTSIDYYMCSRRFLHIAVCLAFFYVLQQVVWMGSLLIAAGMSYFHFINQ